MGQFFKNHKKIMIDFCYSMIAYALPTVILQFVVQPLIAGRTTADENGLFVALFNVVKLMISIFILPLANLRLLKKKECRDHEKINSYFNFLFCFVLLCSLVIGTAFNIIYRQGSLRFPEIARLLTVIFLMGVHDYFSIAFRIILNYKWIVIDNFLIVLGYGLGIVLFTFWGHWEYIFIMGYLFGSAFVLLHTKLWKTSMRRKGGMAIAKQYGELCASSALSNTSTYCDRLIIYPVLGGYSVSVYNAATIVSKAISVVSAPLRNVLLSYIVNRDSLVISKRKVLRYVVLILAGLGVVYIGFLAFSNVACSFLYPQYVESARFYIPLIILSVMIETFAGIANIALLRFAETKLQAVISALKLSVYLASVVVLSVILKLGLWGFCIAIMLAAVTQMIAVFIGLRKRIIVSP